jgi:hypothetical protein
VNRCATVLVSGPRAGQVCGRIFLAPHKQCVRCRPPPPRRVREHNPEWQRRCRERRKRREALAGLGPGMEGA